MFVTKVQYPLHENLPKMETNPRWLPFSPKYFAYNLRSFCCCCFPSIQLKNILVQSLSHLAQKLPKVTNQHMMTCFCTQTIRTSFSVILLLFSINMVKKCLKQKYRTLNTKTCQKWKSTQDNYFFHPNLSQIIIGHFFAVSRQYSSKLFRSKV